MPDGLASGLAVHNPDEQDVTGFPSFPTTGLFGHWDAADLSTITEVGGKVSQWNDKSGQNNHLLQGTAAQQPTSGLNTLATRNVIYFDGGDNTTGNWMRRFGVNQTQADQEYFVVVRIYSVQPRSGCCLGLWSNNSDRGNVRMIGQTDRRFRFNNDAVIPGAPGDNNDLGAGDGQWNPNGVTGSVLTDLNLPDDAWSYVHLTKGNNVSNNGAIYTNLRVGGDGVAGGRYARFDLAELMFYNQALTTEERDRVLLYLTTKWGL